MSKAFVLIALMLFVLWCCMHLTIIPKLRFKYWKESQKYRNKNPKLSEQIELEGKGQEKAYYDFAQWIIFAAMACIAIAGMFVPAID